MDKDTAIILTQSKSMAVGMLITWFFGGLGVFYVSIIGGVILGLLEMVFWIITLFTLGFGVILLVPLHIVALIWTYAGVKKHNKKLIDSLSNSPDASPTVNTTTPITVE